MRKFKLFARFLQGFRKVFFRGSIAKNTHFRGFLHFFSVFAVLLSFRNFRDFHNWYFAVFRQVSQIVFRKFCKYELRKVSQIRVSQFYVCFARFAGLLQKTHIFEAFRTSSQFSQCNSIFRGDFSQLVFRSVSPSFANRVSQVSQIRVLQGFANTSFAVLRLFRKIRKVFDSNSFFFCRIQFST